MGNGHQEQRLIPISFRDYRSRLLSAARARPRRAWALAGGVVLAGSFLSLSPAKLFRDPYSAVLYSREGDVLGAKITSDGQWRFPPMEKVPARFKAALLTREDKHFFHHPGVNPAALVRALWRNYKTGRITSGGSTITMQVVRLARKNPPRTYREKAWEILLALRLELGRSKEDVLALYASHAPFGGNVVGLEAAAWRYFGRSPEGLTWAENCLLAVLPNSPALVHPGRNRQVLQRKRDKLLSELRAAGAMGELDFSLALQEPMPGDPKPLPRLAPHLLETLKAGHKGVPKFKTTLSKRIQAAAQEILGRRSAALSLQHIRNAAALVVDNRDMSVVAYVGNSRVDEYDESGFAVDLVRRPRSTGSLLKPMLYAAMLQSGDLMPTTLVPDIPTQYNGFLPENYDQSYRGMVPAREALARSLNVPAVRLLREYGIARFYLFLKNMGMTTLFRPAEDYGLTLILGGAEGTLWELGAMYANLAAIAQSREEAFQGRYQALRTLQGPAPRTNKICEIGPGAAWLTLQALVEVGRPEDDAYWKNFASGRKVSWKTGTSLGQRDAWAVGVTPRYTVAVWVGNASGEGRPGLTGAAAAGPILFEIFNRLESGPWFARPDFDLKEIPVCRQDGFLPTAGCATEFQEAPLDSHFERASPYQRLVHLDANRRQVNGDCESVSRMTHETWFVLPPGPESYFRKRNPLYRPLPALRSDCREGEADSPIAFLYPQSHTRIFIPVELGSKKEKAVFEAVHRRPDAVLHWHLDGQYLGKTETFHQRAVDVPPGSHRITVVDQFGHHLSRPFEVLEKTRSTSRFR